MSAIRIFSAGGCFLLALFLFVQLLGLLFIEQIADRAVHADDQVRVPVSVRIVGFVADKLHEDVLDAPLDPDGSNWPAGFRIFFILELCGLAGLCLGACQLGAAILRKRTDWRTQAESLLIGSCFAILVGFLLIKLTLASA